MPAKCFWSNDKKGVNMKYATVKSAGMQAFSDAYILGNHTGHTADLYIISLAGTPMQVESISANIYQGTSTSITIDDEIIPVGIGRKSVSVMTQKYSGIAHRIFRVRRYFGEEERGENDKVEERVVYGKTLEDVIRQAFLRFDKAVSIPLLKDWENWLWKDIYHRKKLIGFGDEMFTEAWLISWSVDENDILSKILEALQNDEIN